VFRAAVTLLFTTLVVLLSLGSVAQTERPTTPTHKSSVQQLFESGEKELAAGDLDKAEQDFSKVTTLDPKSAGAYANLGVIYMRREQWERARTFLKKAERLAPQVAGIRLNIGLTYYREAKYAAAIAPFASVVKEHPDSAQARYLLGLCYFFTSRWPEAADTLEALWGQQSLNLTYLYVLDIAAHKAGRTELDQRAAARMVEIGQDTPEFHLLMGKAHLNNDEYDSAIVELEKAVQGDPKLPFIHYSLGIAYMHQQNYQRAAQEFQQEIAADPNSAFSYDRLGIIYAMQQNDAEAEKNFRRALELNPRLPSSQFGLAKIYLREAKYAQALAALDAAEKLAPTDYNIHAVRGQVLQKSGQRDKAREEFALYTKLMNADREKKEKELNGEMLNPDLSSAPER